jgi:hypothetical protein
LHLRGRLMHVNVYNIYMARMAGVVKGRTREN